MNKLTVFSRIASNVTWTREPDGSYTYTHTMGGVGRLLIPPRGTHGAKQIARIILNDCTDDPQKVMRELERMGWQDILKKLRKLVKRGGPSTRPKKKKKVAAPPPTITCWTLSDGLFLYEKTTSKVIHEQKVYFNDNKLIVDEWSLGCSGRWEEERYVVIEPVHFIALASMLGIESIAPISLIQTIAANYSFPDGFERFHDAVDKHDVNHISRTIR
ncbi:MAG: hypothetical protein M3R08_02840 [Bacteroidota bacterium]|nr:hypothetical protein [Bacteroidota bacterium]